MNVLRVGNSDERDVERQVSGPNGVRDARGRAVTEEERERGLRACLEQKLPAIVELDLEATLTTNADEQPAFPQDRVCSGSTNCAVTLGDDREREVDDSHGSWDPSVGSCPNGKPIVNIRSASSSARGVAPTFA